MEYDDYYRYFPLKEAKIRSMYDEKMYIKDFELRIKSYFKVRVLRDFIERRFHTKYSKFYISWGFTEFPKQHLKEKEFWLFDNNEIKTAFKKIRIENRTLKNKNKKIINSDRKNIRCLFKNEIANEIMANRFHPKNMDKWTSWGFYDGFEFEE